MTRVTRIGFPRESRLQARLPAATYLDAFEAELEDNTLTPVQIAARALAATPSWVEGLLGLRDRLVAPLGIKTVGRLGAVRPRSAGPPAVGDRLSIFRVESLDDREVVLGIDDSHLDVRISFLKRPGSLKTTYVVGSLVQTHNLLGRVYMLPVAPFHRMLVAMMMRRVTL